MIGFLFALGIAAAIDDIHTPIYQTPQVYNQYAPKSVEEREAETQRYYYEHELLEQKRFREEMERIERQERFNEMIERSNR